MAKTTLLILLLAPAAAGALGNDVQLWTEAGIRYKIDKQFRLKFDQHLRFDKDVSHIKSIMPELAVVYRPWKFLRLAGGYRYIAEPFDLDGNTYAESWHRLFADLHLRLRLKPVTIRYRLRYQEQFGRPCNGYDCQTDLTAKHALRNKLGVEIKLGMLLPFLALEMFNRFDDDRRIWHKLRTSVGLELGPKRHKFALFYRLEVYLFTDEQGENRRNYGDMDHILALAYHFSI